MARPCDVCGEPFEPKNARQLYCSFRCKQEANRYRARMRVRRKKRKGGAR